LYYQYRGRLLHIIPIFFIQFNQTISICIFSLAYIQYLYLITWLRESLVSKCWHDHY
jgi:hypothetical protein